MSALRKGESVLQLYEAGLNSAAVESTFNRCWLVDGLEARGYLAVFCNRNISLAASRKVPVTYSWVFSFFTA